MTEVHLRFKRLEILGGARLCFPAHLLSRPLLEAIELLDGIHIVRECSEGILCGITGLELSSEGEW